MDGRHVREREEEDMSQWRRREEGGGGHVPVTSPSAQEGDCSCEALEEERKELGMAGQEDRQDLLT